MDFRRRLPGNNFYHRSNNSVKSIGLKKIVNLLEESPETIVLKLCNPHFGFENYLNCERIGNELVKQLIKLIEKCYKCNSLKHQLSSFTSKLIPSNLFQDVIYDALSCKDGTCDIELIRSILRIVCNIIEISPLQADRICKVRDKLELVILNRIQNPELTQEFTVRLVPMENKALDKIKAMQYANSKTFKNIDHANLEPPNDFTEMTIVPTFADIITDQKSFLRKNITNGAYRSVHHYLDVQFRLLREDYLCPLREGISKFRNIVKEAIPDVANFNFNRQLSSAIKRQLNHIDSLSVLFGVDLEDKSYGLNGIIFNLKINQGEKKIRLEHSKRFMFGSLVLLSSDLFMTECLIGVVGEQDIKKLEKGIIQVRFDYDPTNFNSTNNPEFQKLYTMVETSAYFESYKHVLNALVSFKNYTDVDFPFKKNLVDCENLVIDRPEYLKNVPFDFRTIVDQNKKFFIDEKTGITKYEFSDTAEYASRCFLSNDLQWPSADKMMLDESQYNAIKLALTSKLTLIQGPPGTGKTFIGVKIMELLMHNKKLWWNRPGQPKRPILMICYTNHALDQFLNYCIDECQLNSGIIRVGGRCTSEKLKPFLLREVKRKVKDSRGMNEALFNQIRNQTVRFKNLQAKINYPMNIRNKISTSCLISMKLLEEIMEPEIYEQFELSYLDWYEYLGKDYWILEWLGFFEIDAIMETEMGFSSLSFDNQEMMLGGSLEQNGDVSEVNDDDGFDVYANNERILEDDLDEVHYSHGWLSVGTSENLLEAKDLKNMCIRFNASMGSRNLKYLMEEWETFVRCGGRRVKTKNSRIDQFINQKLEQLLKCPIDLDQYEGMNKTNIFQLSHKERIICYRYWLHKYMQTKDQEALEQQQAFNESAKELAELRLQEDRFIMKDALIIAMTTTGSSRYNEVLKDIGPKIVIVEEAAEVFEAHIVSALSKHCEHLILIGDHVQLRPNPNVFKLAKEFKLDVSLFERLIKNNTKSVMLNTQHRMRPEISCLMKHFYDQQIQDHISVNDFPKITGLKSSVFFLSHDHLETQCEDGSSKENKFEAEFIIEFCHYLTKQGYDHADITVLSMYLAQMQLIKRGLRNKELQSVKTCTVDNYQGEENKIVLLSLVRSNKEDKIGFLATNNRVCVALSRAKHGFFCIGNLNLISRNSSKWKSLLEDMNVRNNVGTGLVLTCGIHPKNDIEVTGPEDFKQRPDGGCMLPCDFRLDCGHVCAMKCHTFDLDHNFYTCKKICKMEMPRCGHTCEQLCSHLYACDVCNVKVDKVIEECGHTMRLNCDTSPSRKDCREPCENTLSCGHKCTKFCGMDCGECETRVEVVSNCLHENEKIYVPCRIVGQVWKYPEYCTRICNQTLECEHLCSKSCSKCYGGFIHAECSEKCDRILYCGHKCPSPCSKQCKQCEEKCENRCPHSKCNLKCSEPCSPCKEKCKYGCRHTKCTKLCFEICDRNPCNLPCKRLIKKCGHPCIGLCGEPCPSLCRICGKQDETFDIFFGSEDEPNSRFVLLEDCGHIFESTGMDNWMKAYISENESNVIKLPECPRCRTPIRFTLRYLNYVKRQLKSIDSIKRKHYGDARLNREKKENLLDEIEKHHQTLSRKLYDPELFNFELNFVFKKILDGRKLISENNLMGFQNTWTIYSNLQNTESRFEENKSVLRATNGVDHLSYELNKISKIFNESGILVNQRLTEMSSESQRIDKLLDFYLMEKNVNVLMWDKSYNKSAEDLEKIEDLRKQLKEILVLRIQEFNPDVEQKVKDLFESLAELTDFKISKQELQMIHKAMNLSQGHWFKCPNDHIYCITECGGAMEKSTCPECKEEIGGTSHQLLSSNKLASEMDGAKFAAWSDTANNIGNWEL